MKKRTQRSWHRRKEHEPPSFLPEAVDEYIVQETNVLHLVRLNRFIVSLNMAESLRNERIDGYYLARNLRLGFECASKPFFLKEATVRAAVITFTVVGSPSLLDRFTRIEPLLLQYSRNPERKLRVPFYTFSILELPKPPDSDDNLR